MVQKAHFANRAAKFFYTVWFVSQEGVATVFVTKFGKISDMKKGMNAIGQQHIARSMVAGNAFGKFCDCVRNLQIRISEFANEAKSLGLKDTATFA
tara:strand:- start:297 stop:584 length:288 start_codon:yes stop_codon:yes gene_type:complete